MRQKLASMGGVERFGLKSVRDLKQLDDRTIKVLVSLYPASVDWLFKLPISERRKALKKWHKKTFKAITTAVPLKQIKKEKKGDRFIRSFTCKLAARHVMELLSQTGISMVWLAAVKGIKPQEPFLPPRRRQWYAVRARYAIQVEGATKGRQSYEDRIVLVRARSFKQAAKKFRKQERDYGRPYLNSDCEMVRWHLEQITDIYQTDIENLDSEDTEVYSRLSRRRMKRRYEWHPPETPCSLQPGRTTLWGH